MSDQTPHYFVSGVCEHCGASQKSRASFLECSQNAFDFSIDPSELAKRLDPDTSKEAAQRLRPGSLRLKLLKAYALVGFEPMSDQEAEMVAVREFGAVAFRGGPQKRCSDLRRLEWIVRAPGDAGTGIDKISGREVMRCWITPLGVETLESVVANV